MAKKKLKSGIQVESVKHKDKRANIPTEELRGFVKEDETQPRKVVYPGLLYARDPSLDPQLVWKGKDEQDAKPLEVSAVPIYIQEKIHPQAIIEDVRRNAAVAQAPSPAQKQLELFADFNGIQFEDLIEFYQHEANWSNRMILGDSLLVMTSLAEKEALKGKVQMIYIDPPYGIKFGSNWQVSTRKRDVKDGKTEDRTRQPEQIRAFRDTWELGIHSYLAYWRDRLVAARELLTETGSVFAQIGDENVHLIRCMMDEVFGSSNCCGIVIVRKTSAPTDRYIPGVADFLLWYGKDASQTKYRQLNQVKRVNEEGGSQYVWLELPSGAERKLTGEEREDPSAIPIDARFFAASDASSSHEYSLGRELVEFRGRSYGPGGRYWSTSPQGMARIKWTNRLLVTGRTLFYKRYLEDFPVFPLSNMWTDTSSSFGERLYVVQTTTKTVERCLLMTTDPGDLVLDPTCGSGTTAYVAEQWGRRWITIDTSRVALALARTRLMTAKFPYYLLSDSPEGLKKESEIIGHPPASYKTGGDIKKGFVYKRVPHITLKSIANNEEIDAIHARWQQKLDPLRATINKVARKNWQEWEIPRDLTASNPQTPNKKSEISTLRSEIAEYWRLRRERQKEVDASIARHAETELLYDQPYEDNKRIRVTGPFTVESLSPHRTISVEGKKQLMKPDPEGFQWRTYGTDTFGHLVIDNIRTAGVQNTIKQERLKFDRLEPYAGTWIHAAGEYTEKDGKVRRVAVCIGPEHGTVGADLVHEAAKEAVQGVGFDTLVVCGFAFDPHVSEEAKRYGKLVVLPARIHADLQLGDGYLKKTGAANLFTVFGEPDLDVRKDKDGKYVVEIRGLDVYDPTTSEVRSHTTDDIACWFIDTNYNEESFFVRHAYFTGAQEPYEKLKRALRAEINEAAWQTLYSTKSLPFDPPETGKIAVKVINHYGDEVMKVYDCEPTSKARKSS